MRVQERWGRAESERCTCIPLEFSDKQGRRRVKKKTISLEGKERRIRSQWVSRVFVWKMVKVECIALISYTYMILTCLPRLRWTVRNVTRLNFYHISNFHQSQLTRDYVLWNYAKLHRIMVARIIRKLSRQLALFLHLSDIFGYRRSLSIMCNVI